MTIYATGIPNFAGDPTNNTPVIKFVGTSLVYTSTNNGLVFIRSNATSAMTDTLPAPDLSIMGNGWNFQISNQDASASITLSAPTGYLVNGAASVTITDGVTKRIVWDTLNATFWAI